MLFFYLKNPFSFIKSEWQPFTLLFRVKENGNTNICVTNKTIDFTGELIKAITGSLKSVYLGHKQEKGFDPSDIFCIPHCYILVSDKLAFIFYLQKDSSSDTYRQLAKFVTRQLYL